MPIFSWNIKKNSMPKLGRPGERHDVAPRWLLVSREPIRLSWTTEGKEKRPSKGHATFTWWFTLCPDVLSLPLTFWLPIVSNPFPLHCASTIYDAGVGGPWNPRNPPTNLAGPPILHRQFCRQLSTNKTNAGERARAREKKGDMTHVGRRAVVWATRSTLLMSGTWKGSSRVPGHVLCTGITNSFPSSEFGVTSEAANTLRNFLGGPGGDDTGHSKP